MAAYESELEGLRAQSHAKHAALQGSLDLFKQQHTNMQAQLEIRTHEVSQLRQATELARDRIELVLDRLPGVMLEGAE